MGSLGSAGRSPSPQLSNPGVFGVLAVSPSPIVSNPLRRGDQRAWVPQVFDQQFDMFVSSVCTAVDAADTHASVHVESPTAQLEMQVTTDLQAASFAQSWSPRNTSYVMQSAHD